MDNTKVRKKSLGMMDIKIINIIEKLLKPTIHQKFFKGIYNIHKCFCYVPFSVISNSCMFYSCDLLLLMHLRRDFSVSWWFFEIWYSNTRVEYFFFWEKILNILLRHMWICSIFFFFVFCFVIFKSDGLVTLGTPCWHYELMGIVCFF